MTLIALVDGPLGPAHPACAEIAEPAGPAAEDSPAGAHARLVAATILSHAPDARFLSLPVFTGRLAARAADLAAALDLAAASGAEIVHCSLGLARADADVARALARLAGRVVVASAPARGDPVWPAADARVLAVQGDARCGKAEWSRLDLPGADYGACPRAEDGTAGASLAAAHLTGLLAGAGAVQDADAARRFLDAAPAYRGRERRRV